MCMFLLLPSKSKVKDVNIFTGILFYTGIHTFPQTEYEYFFQLWPQWRCSRQQRHTRTSPVPPSLSGNNSVFVCVHFIEKGRKKTSVKTIKSQLSLLFFVLLKDFFLSERRKPENIFGALWWQKNALHMKRTRRFVMCSMHHERLVPLCRSRPLIQRLKINK